MEQAKVAIRLHMQRVIGSGVSAGSTSGLSTDPAIDPVGAHEEFLVELRHCVLSQGILCPHVDPELPELAAPVDVPGSGAQLVVLGAGVLGIVGLLFGIGRFAGFPWLGLLVGLVLAMIVGWVRYVTFQRQLQVAQNQADAQALKQAWAAQVSEVIARLHVPQVVDQLKLKTGGQ